jgi:hypothetical protein
MRTSLPASIMRASLHEASGDHLLMMNDDE